MFLEEYYRVLLASTEATVLPLAAAEEEEWGPSLEQWSFSGELLIEASPERKALLPSLSSSRGSFSILCCDAVIESMGNGLEERRKRGGSPIIRKAFPHPSSDLLLLSST